MYRNYRGIIVAGEDRVIPLPYSIGLPNKHCRYAVQTTHKWTCKSGNIDTGFHFLLHPRLQKSTECDCLLSQHGLNLSGQIEGTRQSNVTFCASAHNSPLQEITPWD